MRFPKSVAVFVMTLNFVMKSTYNQMIKQLLSNIAIFAQNSKVFNGPLQFKGHKKMTANISSWWDFVYYVLNTTDMTEPTGSGKNRHSVYL